MCVCDVFEKEKNLFRFLILSFDFGGGRNQARKTDPSIPLHYPLYSRLLTHLHQPSSPHLPTIMLPLTLLLTLLLPSTPILTLTLLPPSTLNPPPLTYALTCTPRTTFLTCPDYYDCAQAVLSLPNFEGEWPFHNGLPNDPYRLPVVKEHGSCRVTVELRHQGGSRESSNWEWIIARALEMND